MKKCVLIGGGEIGKGNTKYETKEIDEEIVKLTHKTNPIFLFIGLANQYSDSYYDVIKKIYKSLGCTTTYLKKKNILNNPSIVKEKIKNADIIYIGGGDTIKLIKEIKEYKIEALIKEAYNKGCVIAGISAGAILIAKEGFSDSRILRKEKERHEFIEGINIVDISICPHYHSNDQKTKELKEEIIKKKTKVYALENGTALKIIDNNISIIKSIENNNVYLCHKLKNYKETKL